MKDKDLEIHYIACWPIKKTKDNYSVAALIPPSKPIEWALQRTLGDLFLAGKELFFPRTTNQGTFENNMQKCPFYLWPLQENVFTNSARHLKDILYELGEFDLEQKVREVDLKGLFPLLPPFRTQIGDIQKVPYGINDLWNKIFELGSSFDGFGIHWIEDQKRALEEAGQSAEGFEDNKINLCEIRKKKAGKCISFENLSELLTELKSIAADDGFKIFLVDMYYDIAEDHESTSLKIFGDNIIEVIRGGEKGRTGRLRNLVIVYTSGTSPFIVSRTKALNADLVVFKQTGERWESGLHGPSSSKGRFLLFWSIYWPLSLMSFICGKLKKVLDKKNNLGDVKKQLEEISTAVGKLCPEGLFFFKQEWSRELKRTLGKWILALEDKKGGMEEEIKKDINKLLDQAFIPQKKKWT